jgi:hypothetical protein
MVELLWRVSMSLEVVELDKRMVEIGHSNPS